MHHKRYSSAYRFLVSLSAVMMIIAGMVTIYAAAAFWYDSPYTLIAASKTRELASILTMLSSGGAFFLGGLASFVETNYGYQII